MADIFDKISPAKTSERSYETRKSDIFDKIDIDTQATTVQSQSLLDRFSKQLYNEFSQIPMNIAKAGPVTMKVRNRLASVIGKFSPKAEKLYRGVAIKGQEEREQWLGTNIPQAIVPKPETIAETGVDIGAGITSWALQLILLKKILPAKTPTAVIWEAQNLLSGGRPGEGALYYGAFAAPGKLIKGTTLAARTGRLTAESLSLAGMSAIEQKIDTGEIDPVQVATAAGLPLALRTPGAIKSLIRRRSPKVIRAIRKTHPEVEAEIQAPVTKAKRKEMLAYQARGVFPKVTPGIEPKIIERPKARVGKPAAKFDLRKAAERLKKPVEVPTIEDTNKIVSKWSKEAKSINKKKRVEAVHKFRKST
jgi:hypothetical protein